MLPVRAGLLSAACLLTGASLAQVPAPTGMPTAQAAAAEPSLEATQAFLAEKIIAADPNQTSVITQVSWNGCTFIEKRIIQGAFPIVYTLNLHEIEGFKITSTIYEGRQSYALIIQDDNISEDDLWHEASDKDVRHNPDQHKKLSELGIGFADHELATRVAKAFAHAVILCGGPKKQPF